MSLVKRKCTSYSHFLTSSYLVPLTLSKIFEKFLPFPLCLLPDRTGGFRWLVRQRLAAICWSAFLLNRTRGTQNGSSHRVSLVLSDPSQWHVREVKALHAPHQVWVPRFMGRKKRTLVQAALSKLDLAVIKTHIFISVSCGQFSVGS